MALGLSAPGVRAFAIGPRRGAQGGSVIRAATPHASLDVALAEIVQAAQETRPAQSTVTASRYRRRTMDVGDARGSLQLATDLTPDPLREMAAGIPCARSIPDPGMGHPARGRRFEREAVAFPRGDDGPPITTDRPGVHGP